MDYYPDPILDECRQRKAHVIEKSGGWKGYLKHLDDETLRPDGKPWPVASPENLAALQAKPVCKKMG
jgi:hypothetical protein